MLSNNVQNRMFYVNIFTGLFGICVFVGNVSAAIRCYQCGTNLKIGGCDNINPSNEHLYAIKCPTNSQGCITEKQDGIVINKDCVDLQFNECQVANNVEYCYCNFDLCNGIKSISINKVDLTDDEDMIEGSGHTTSLTNNKETIAPTQQPTTRPSNSGSRFHTTLAGIAAIILLY